VEGAYRLNMKQMLSILKSVFWLWLCGPLLLRWLLWRSAHLSVT